jgi:hypothetical protein
MNRGDMRTSQRYHIEEVRSESIIDVQRRR